MKAVLLIDDLAHKQGKRVEADGTHLLSLDGKTVELDLTTAHYGELVQKLAVYFEAGSKPGGNGQRPARKTGAGRKTDAWYQGLVAFAGREGRMDEITRSPGGRPQYGGQLRADYEAQLKA